MDYTDKLKDPRWQKKRLKILERDKWECKRCYNAESILHVHHRVYKKAKNPWDYTNDDLITLCEDCHKHERKSRPEYEQMLLSALREKFLADDIFSLTYGLLNLKPFNVSEVMASIYEMAFSDPGAQKMLSKMFWDKTIKKGSIDNG